MQPISVSDKQYEKLLKEFYPKRTTCHYLSKAETIAIAERLNEKITLAYLSEEKEHRVLLKVVLRIDHFIFEHLPLEIYALTHDTDKGFDELEAAQLAARISRTAQHNLCFPFLSEQQEFSTLSFVISVLLNAMREGCNLEHAIQNTAHPSMMSNSLPLPEIL